MSEFSKGSAIIKSTDRYEISDMDISSDPSYFGYISSNGEWYIKQLNETNGTIRFASGLNNYTTNWTNKSSLTYSPYNEIF